MKNIALERAIAVLGGPTETSHVLRVSYWTIREWRKAGRVRDSQMAILLAEAAQAAGAGDVTVRSLAGLHSNGGPNGGQEARSGSSRTCHESREVDAASPLIDAPLALAA